MVFAEIKVPVNGVPVGAIKRVELAMLQAAHAAIAEYIDDGGVSLKSDLCPEFSCTICTRNASPEWCGGCSRASVISRTDYFNEKADGE